ncbi:MAG TPA: GNAT family N-acetyltransferase [Armatimonadota bacterium]|nr:GNAT family N-acetyltransferase [Armatimonadota bacterium]
MAAPRPVEPNEIEDLADLIGSVFGLDDHYSKEHMVSKMRRPTDRRSTLVVVEHGQVVSHIRTVYSRVSVYGCEFNVASVGTVLTRPEYRGKGHAGAILEMSLRDMARKRAKVMIVSGDRGLYRRAHCVPAGRVLSGTVRRDDLQDRGAGVSVRRVGPEDWPLLAPMHQAESVRFVRPVGFVEKLPFWWDCEYPELWLVERAGDPVAYAGLAREWDRKEGSKRRRVWEYAGSRAALVEALPAIFEETGLDEVAFGVLGHDRELSYLLRRQGVALEERRSVGTLRLIDLPGLMRRLRPYLRERLERRDLRSLSFDQEGDRCVFAYGEERLECGVAEATPLVLAGPHAPKVTGDLKRVLARVFPVPLPMAGFNFV